MDIIEAAIIGGGPAGISAALQLSRMDVATVLFDRKKLGGLVLNANLIENYPGLDHPLSGTRLAEILGRQLARTSAQVINDHVTALDYDGGLFHLKTAGENFRARTVLLATGTKARKMTDFDIPDDMKSRVRSEIYPLLKYSDKEIVIIGAGDAAFDYALNLARRNRVTILNRSDKTKCLRLLYDRVLSQERIVYCENTSVSGLERGSDDRLRLNTISKTNSGSIECDYLITAIGRDSNLDLLSDNLQSQMQILMDKNILYLAGDVKNGIYRQASIASGEGIREAMRIARFLQGLEL